MGRPPRVATGDMVYHVLNRANGRQALFSLDTDYAAFENILTEAVQRLAMRLLAYCVMPNHWHLILWPRAAGDLSRFMAWLTLTHTQRWHAHHHTVGTGHLYQGRFKSFPVQTDDYFLTVCRYVERNPVRAGLVPQAALWRWSSAGRRHRSPEDTEWCHPWPVPRPADWEQWVDTPLTLEELQRVRQCVQRGQPFGPPDWQQHTALHLGLGSTLRPRGRPRKTPDAEKVSDTFL